MKKTFCDTCQRDIPEDSGIAIGLLVHAVRYVGPQQTAVTDKNETAHLDFCSTDCAYDFLKRRRAILGEIGEPFSDSGSPGDALTARYYGAISKEEVERAKERMGGMP